MHRADNLLKGFSRFTSVAIAASLTLAMGCSVSDQKGENGAEHAEVRTPVGNLKVQTNINPKDVGLAIYPGAHLKPSDVTDKDKSANVNISTPFFGLKVIALDYVSDDSPQKVIDFYKKEMARYGKVAECKGAKGEEWPGANVGGTSHDGQIKLNLSCDDTGSGNSTELKAGEGNSQHIVGVTPESKGTEFGLVYIQVRGKAETM